MKHFVHFITLGALAISSCTSSEILDEGVQSNAIGFEHEVGKPSRAEQAQDGDLTTATLDKFLVYGYFTRENQTANPIQAFAGDAVTKNGDGVWGYKNTRYWVPGATYHFFAYSCADTELNNKYGTSGIELNGVGNDRTLKISNYRCDQFHNHDLIYAESRDLHSEEKSESNPTPNAKVEFNFSHILTKIDAVFISEFASDYDIVIKDVRIINFRNVGSFAGNGKGNNGWKDQERSFYNPDVQGTTVQNIEKQLPFPDNNIGVARAGNSTVTAKTPKTNSVYMIPYTYTQSDVHIQFTIEVYKGEEHTQKNLAMSRNMVGTWSPTWEQGTYYTYTIRLTGTAANLQPIVFESKVSLNDWGTSTSTATDISFSTN